MEQTIDTDLNETADGFEAAEDVNETTNIETDIDQSTLDASKSSEPSTENDENGQQANDKSISRSGRVIKKTKYLHDEFGDSPIVTKKKRPSDASITKMKKEDENDEERSLLSTETAMLEYDIEIKNSLQLSSADPQKCISILEKYKNLKITKLMLKKNPGAVDTIKRLRRYIGNMKTWNFTDDEIEEFNKKAAKIRELSELIYKNFKVHFN